MMGFQHYIRYKVRIRTDAIETLRAAILTDGVRNFFRVVPDGYDLYAHDRGEWPTLPYASGDCRITQRPAGGTLECAHCGLLATETAQNITAFSLGAVADAASETVVVDRSFDGVGSQFVIAPPDCYRLTEPPAMPTDEALSAFLLKRVTDEIIPRLTVTDAACLSDMLDELNDKQCGFS